MSHRSPFIVVDGGFIRFIINSSLTTAPDMLNSASMARPWASVNPVDALVERATDPMMPEPNFAVNLELAEYVNAKKANT